MKVGDIVKFNAIGRSTPWSAPHLYPHKYEIGIVVGYFRGLFNDGEPVGPNGDTALKVIFPSKIGEWRRSILELVSESR